MSRHDIKNFYKNLRGSYFQRKESLKNLHKLYLLMLMQPKFPSISNLKNKDKSFGKTN